jgi:hypothetical protein
MLEECEVTGERCSGADAGEVLGVVVVVPADAPPVLAARALDAPVAAIVRLQKTALRMRNRKTTTSFVGLRG